MINYVKINGVSSQTITGLAINELPPITKPEMRATKEEIDGRDGDIITKLGYSAYDKTITIGLWGTAYDVNEVIKFFNKEGTIVFSNEADKYYNFTMLNSIDIERLLKFKTASITFHCQPFKYPLSETPLEIEYDYIEDEGETLTLNNTGNALMKLDLKGNTSQSGTPTPTSPVAVNVVSGDNTIKTIGKNLLPNDKASYTEKGITLTRNSDGTYTVNGTATEDYSVAICDNFVPMTGTWRMLGCPSGGSASTYMLSAYVGYWGSANPNIDTGSGTNITYTGNVKVRFYIKSGTQCNNLIFKPMLTTDTSATIADFQPYTSQTYEVDLPVENMLDNSKISSTSGVLTTTYLGGTRYRIQGLATGNKVFMTGLGIPTGNYTISATLVSGSYSGGSLVIQDQNNTSAGEITIGALGVKKSISISNKNIGRLILWNTQTFDATFDIQIEPGTKANSYTEYGTTPIELCKIGTYQDYFTKNSDGEWCKYNAIGKVVLDGTDVAFTYESQSTLPNSLMIPSSSRQTGLGDVSSVKCSHFSNIASGSGSTLNTLYWGSSTQMWLCKDGFTSLSAGNTWLQSNNVSIYYVLATPYLSLIEDNNLIEQLDNIQNAVSYTGQTNISQVNNDKAFIISAKALEKGTNEVVVNNIGNIYSKPLLALEGNGNVDIYLNNTQILKANVEDKMNIDIAQLEAYNPDTMTLLNRQVIGNYNSMTLQPGNNTIRIDGSLDKATITNYIRWL